MDNTIFPCLWFDGKAKEAATFYCSVFRESNIIRENLLMVKFEISDQQFMCLNGRPNFKINPSISFYVVCETEEETDFAWNKLVDDGIILMPYDAYPWSEKYGWVQDKYGVSWQISFGKITDVGQKFTPSFLFTKEQSGKAEQAVKFYTSIFEDSAITGITRFEDSESEPKGNVKHAQFIVNDYVMMAMDSASSIQFSFNEAISLVVMCETQDEIDYYWNKLTEDGEESSGGWLKDKFGVSWQIVPTILEKLMSDTEKYDRIAKALMQMKKFDIATLMKA